MCAHTKLRRSNTFKNSNGHKNTEIQTRTAAQKIMHVAYENEQVRAPAHVCERVVFYGVL